MSYSRIGVGFTLTLIVLVFPLVAAAGKDSLPTPAFTDRLSRSS
jgi:hypothetical protein